MYQVAKLKTRWNESTRAKSRDALKDGTEGPYSNSYYVIGNTLSWKRGQLVTEKGRI